MPPGPSTCLLSPDSLLDLAQAFYILHPTWLLKYWVFMLRLSIPDPYGLVRYVDRLADLERLMGPGALNIPQHVRDYDSTLK